MLVTHNLNKIKYVSLKVLKRDIKRKQNELLDMLEKIRKNRPLPNCKKKNSIVVRKKESSRYNLQTGDVQTKGVLITTEKGTEITEVALVNVALQKLDKLLCKENLFRNREKRFEMTCNISIRLYSSKTLEMFPRMKRKLKANVVWF